MKCPLCQNSKYFKVKKYSVKELGHQWRKVFGFNPFNQQSHIPTIEKLQCSECQLLFYNPSIYGDSFFYELLSKNFWYYEENKWEFDEAIKIIRKYKPDSLLEVGCGKGFFLEKISSFVTEIQGLEINPEALKICQEKGLKVSSTTISNINRNYAMVILFEVLEHLDKITETLVDVSRIIEPGGLLLIAVPNPDGYLRDCEPVLLDLPPHHNSAWPIETFDYLAKKFNLQQVYYNTEPLRYIHYLVYLTSLTNQILNKEGLKKKIVSKINTLANYCFAPFFYPLAQQYIPGQTHLVVFKKY